MRRRRPQILASALAAGALLVAGCGGGSSPNVANVNSSTSTSSAASSNSDAPPTAAQRQQAQRETTRFVSCMRSHGVSVINPNVSPHGFKDAFNSPSPAFRSADTVCGHFLPAGHGPSQSAQASTRAQTAALLELASCMRSHAFPSFPDPTSRGQLNREMLARARIDLHAPAVVHAADLCTSATHGVITRAMVAHFVAGH
ncbi:MAG TPA: hypothetical protein VKS25_11855 [Solirubrobacteraceae bacterium]|nr:hypothetical protein [Solirubrobacteraceae bacterium]